MLDKTKTLDPMQTLVGSVIHSEAQPGVRFELERVVGEGGMGAAFLARRDGPEGSAPVVVKIMRPDFGNGEVPAELVAVKEAVALGRLNERLPPTPFVVRFVDAGTARLFPGLRTPWTAIEYVHGGIEGTTLEDRVTYSLHKTGYGFHAARAAHAIRCLSHGLSAIHAVDVVHRDLTPANVLCCGFGETEIFKITDFGVARAIGIQKTFVGLNLGTLGYSAPESAYATAGPHSDVFSLASVVFYLLTGQRYFEVSTPRDAVEAYTSEFRPSITDYETLHPELLRRPETCRVIDRELARASAVRVERRPRTARELAQPLLSALAESSLPHSSHDLLSAVLSTRRPPVDQSHHFAVRSRPRSDLVVTSVAWDTDGHALAISPEGAWFWNGQSFADASGLLTKLPARATFTVRHEAGGWLLGGNGASLHVLDTVGTGTALEGPRPEVAFTHASGHVDELLAAVEMRAGHPPTLWCASKRRWFRPFPLPEVAHVAVLQRLDESRWLVGGRRVAGGGFAAIYSPLKDAVEVLATPNLRSFISGASAPERCLGLLVGSGGVVLRVDGKTVSAFTIPGEPDLSAAGLDVLGQEWATGAGSLFGRDASERGSFRLLWSDESFSTPFVSVMADMGRVIAMTADGGIVEGRLNRERYRAPSEPFEAAYPG